ncbi:MAG: restriction endonuclease subunit R [Bryobacteraceae bacterium]
MTQEQSAEPRFYYFAGADSEDQVFSNIAGISLALHRAFPEYFHPYLFNRRFDRFSAICDAFTIPIPKPPGKMQKRDRALYYLAVNQALQEFRRKYGLTPPEMVAFLYDFARRVLDAEQDSELPPPSKVWFTMGGVGDNGDFEFLDQADKTSTGIWQGNLDTRRGDVILMWCVTPRSYLHSICRAITDGFADPFFYFYSTVEVGDFVKVPPVVFKEFAEHPVLSLNKSVKAHFQGAGGKRFPLEDYLVLLGILSGKGFDISKLPIPPSHVFDLPEGLENERDVEIQLVEPLLRRLGYTDTDWVRQMPLRMGRGERNFPDYAIDANTKRGEESAALLIEAKYEIATRQQREDAYLQGKSYALRLQASAFLLAAKEGI